MDAEQALRAVIEPAMAAGEVVVALEAVGRSHLSLRRRLQAELLHGKLTELAELAAACGWKGTALIRDGRALIEHDGVALEPAHAHFRGSGPSPAAKLISTLDMHGVRPRAIVDLEAGAGEVAILLANRYPDCRVIAAEGSLERMAAFDSNLRLQPKPLRNLDVAFLGLGVRRAETLQSLCEARGIRRLDLLKCHVGPDKPALALSVRALVGRIAVACITFSGRPADHAELLAAFEDAGLAMVEKRNQPIDDPRAWLERHLKGDGDVTAWFLARPLLGRPSRSAGRRPRGPERPVGDVGARARIYGVLDRWRRKLAPADLRFEFERLYAEDPDPWRYRTRPYELLKYRRTLGTAMRIKPDAKSVLEVGCSIGVLTRALARTFPDITALDMAAEALKLARRRNGGGKVRFIRSDIRRFKPREVFDLIFCAETLYYMPYEDAPQVLRALCSALAAGAVLVVTMPPSVALAGVDPVAGWKRRFLDGGLRLLSEEAFDDDGHYLIQVYEKDDDAG